MVILSIGQTGCTRVQLTAGQRSNCTLILSIGQTDCIHEQLTVGQRSNRTESITASAYWFVFVTELNWCYYWLQHNFAVWTEQCPCITRVKIVWMLYLLQSILGGNILNQGGHNIGHSKQNSISTCVLFGTVSKVELFHCTFAKFLKKFITYCFNIDIYFSSGKVSGV